MKKTLKSRAITLFTALIVGFTALFGLFSAGKTAFGASSSEHDTMSKMQISTDYTGGDELGGVLPKGTVFNLIFDFSTINADTLWMSVDVCVGPLRADGNGFDTDIAKNLKVKSHEDEDGYHVLDIDYGVLDSRAYRFTTLDRFSTAPLGESSGYVRFGAAGNAGRQSLLLKSDKTFTVTLPIEVTEDIETDVITFGVWREDAKDKYTATDGFTFGISSSLKDCFVSTRLSQGLIETNEAVIRLKPAAYLTALYIGTSTNNLTNLDLTVKPITYKLDKDIKQVYLKPVFTDDTLSSLATAGDEGEHTIIDHNAVESVVIKSGKIITLVIEDLKGNDLQVVEIQLIFSSVRLSGLTAAAGTAETTNTGLQGTFNGEVFAYTVKVPSDSAKAAITASVLENDEASKTLTLHSDGCTAPATATDGTEFEVTDITDGATLDITVNSKDGILSKTYEITFVHVSTDTGITSFTLRRSDRIYQNDKTKLEENECDYYFEIAEEEGCSAIIAVAEGATYKVTGLNGGLYVEGEYTVTVTAEAGNSREYKVKVAVAEEEPSFKFYNVLKPVDYVVESVSFTAVNCFYFPFRIINIVLWDVIVAIFG